ncbi:hypothetical protein BDP27DRAFT_1396774 [Rhodocollybia butyracea]|uniref:AB hydrolase-1 domain-containing protein n=1 Tax=Rhodocollybia butyracea TaxID=206335 RepID=A0A9P5QCS9_9AGAR|nr:hypothetical protein BDP27DRAFT_1396774 [Rhodocollybia butyracea]
MNERLIHLVYIHGFRDNIPKRLNLKVQSSLYPTYKSVKPISYATRDFLAWLRTQPPGPVLLLGHSMGGLLAAQAATDLSNNNDGSKRIVGMIAFDCPYLGMHPHVVITGLASLMPKKNDSNVKTETELNPHPNIRIIDQKETQSLDHAPSSPSPSPLSSQSPSPSSSSTNSWLSVHNPPDSFIGRTMQFISTHSDDPVVRWARKHSDEPMTAGRRWVVEHFQFGSCMFDPSGLKDRYKALVAWDGLWVNYWTITDLKPIADEPNRSEERKEKESYQLDDNNEALVETGIAESLAEVSDPEPLPYSPPHSSSPEEPVLLGPKTKAQVKADAKISEKERKVQDKEQKKREKEHEKQRKVSQKDAANKYKGKVGRHFVVLPTGLGAILGGSDHWEKVVIGGVDDEVAAHCGLFIPGQNLDYERLVERVGLRVIEWCNMIR